MSHTMSLHVRRFHNCIETTAEQGKETDSKEENSATLDSCNSEQEQEDGEETSAQVHRPDGAR